ncbi:MAG: hypothetical protein D6815_05715, partial [Candidatus Dadabacteria bacterium]
MNRYRITGTLTCRAPTHLGSGEDSEDVDALVQTDCFGHPILTGSAVKGVLRNYLLARADDDQARKRVLALLGTAGDDLDAKGAISGRVCIEDAPRCSSITKRELLKPDVPPYWDSERGTFRVTSVCIDATSGAAKAHHLFDMEVVPAGTRFSLTLTAWNVTDAEVGMLLEALDAFNNESGALSVGAHTGRGFGRLAWKLGDIRLFGLRVASCTYDEEDRRKAWQKTLGQAPARDNGLGIEIRLLVEAAGTRVSDRQQEFLNEWQAVASQGPADRFDLSLPYTLTLESSLVTRAGVATDTGDGKAAQPSHYSMLTHSNAKFRGIEFAMRSPGVPTNENPATRECEVAGPAWHVVLDGNGEPHLRFEIAGSGLRGVARSFLSRVCAEFRNPRHPTDLFGSTEAGGRIEFENAVPDMPGISPWRYEDLELRAAESPPMRVHERGPVDRTTAGAKAGGLHRFAGVEKGNTFKGRILIRDVTEYDVALLRLWRAAVNERQLALGGVGAAGFGLVQLEFGSPKLLPCSLIIDECEAEGQEDGENRCRRQRIEQELAGINSGCVDCRSPRQSGPTEEPSACVARDAPAPAEQSGSNDEEKHKHYMNPFDFVPFPRNSQGKLIGPVTKTIAEWERGDALGGAESEAAELLSGTMTVSLKALQPVHIMGRRAEKKPFAGFRFHREATGPVIPGASLRGMLRSYIEARWNCWVSIYTRNADWYRHKERGEDVPPKTDNNPYMRKYGERYVGFNTDTDWQDWSRQRGWKRKISPAIPGEFLPPEPDTEEWTSRRIDLATFLFGAVLQDRAREQRRSTDEYRDPALRGRLRFGSAALKEECLDNDTYWIPDLQTPPSRKNPNAEESDAFIGGAKPSKSTMWYFRPGTVRYRRTGRHTVAQFVAGEFRGRKFYFHQDWQTCVETYLDPGSQENFWARGRKKNDVFRRTLECMKPNE